MSIHVANDVIVPAKPQCWKCDSFDIDTQKEPSCIVRTCRACGVVWHDLYRNSGHYCQGTIGPNTSTRTGKLDVGSATKTKYRG